jgi:hypothetical protein
MFSVRLGEFNKAKAAGAMTIAFAIQGLTSKQTDIVARHDVIALYGIMGEEGLVWNIRAPGGDLPYEFMKDFLRKSKETEPYLWPVRKHDVFDWSNSEELCKIATDLLVYNSRDWAVKAAGPYSAELTKPLGLVAAYFGVEL